MQVRQLMNQPAVTCSPRDTLHRAAGLMWEHDCGALPVVDDNGHIAGMITDRDICMAAYTQGRPLHAVPVNEIMSRTVFSVGQARGDDRRSDRHARSRVGAAARPAAPTPVALRSSLRCTSRQLPSCSRTSTASCHPGWRPRHP